jgi:uncharacterized protein (TIGR00255 family)
MIRSMTGFGRAEGVVNDRKVTVEVRSLNSKQLDLLLKLPGAFKDYEVEVRQYIGTLVVRGKAEVYLSGDQMHAYKRTSFDTDLVRAYHEELQAVRAAVAPEATTDLFAHVLRMPDVANTTTDRISEEEWAQARALVEQAATAYDEFRKSEGQRLQEVLSAHVERIGELLARTETLDPDRAERTRERLMTKLGELQAKVDQDRFEQELVYYLEKMDVTEEKVRLRSHCTYFMETMAQDEPQGRKLNFIAQEMGREINTLGSKAADATIQQVVVMMKDELEKVKEQVLNVL